jgi:hypothetical protein
MTFLDQTIFVDVASLLLRGSMVASLLTVASIPSIQQEA